MPITVKNPALAIMLAIAVAGCHSSQKTTTRPESKPATASSSSPRFIDNVSTKPGTRRKARREEEAEAPSTTYTSPPIEKSDASIRFKYAILLDIPVENVAADKLLTCIDDWYGTPYRYGGTTHSGVDCSSFVQHFMTTVYGLAVPRTSIDQYRQSKRVNKKQLQEGDLVFFKTSSGRAVSHVGVYLQNNKFVHASTSSGVTISDLDETYYSRHYVGAGRVL